MIPVIGFVEMWQRKGMNDEFIYYSIAKEYLLEVQQNMYKEIHEADEMKIPLHIRNIFIDKLEERKGLINHLLEDVLYKIKEIESELESRIPTKKNKYE